MLTVNCAKTAKNVKRIANMAIEIPKDVSWEKPFLIVTFLRQAWGFQHNNPCYATFTTCYLSVSHSGGYWQLDPNFIYLLLSQSWVVLQIVKRFVYEISNDNNSVFFCYSWRETVLRLPSIFWTKFNILLKINHHHRHYCYL